MSFGGGGLVGPGLGLGEPDEQHLAVIYCYLYVLYSNAALPFCIGTLPVVMLLSYWCFAGNRDKEDR